MSGNFFGGGMFVWWILIIVAVLIVFKWLASSNASGTGKSARQILDERYARGEIDKLEYEQKKRDLE